MFIDGEYIMSSTFGTLQLGFSKSCLTRMEFSEAIEPDKANSDLCEGWLDWLADFSSQSTSEQWKRLAPQGSVFQKLVWRSLLEIPIGEQLHYSDVALQLGRPKATRAVASAIAANPICLLIPCHRVVPLKGGTGQYRWGAQRKQSLHAAESAPRTRLKNLFF